MDTFAIVKLIHFITVSVFLLIYLVKTIMLLANKDEQLESLNGILIIFEIMISFVILITGIMLIIQSSQFYNYLLLAKYVLFLLSIPLAIIGFKKANKFMAVTSLVFLIVTFGLGEMAKKYGFILGVPVEVQDAKSASYDLGKHGEALYMSGCVRCHGEDGTSAIRGAADLSVSVMKPEDKLKVIKKGHNDMPAFIMLTDQDLKAIVFYIEANISGKHES
jgi:cytochrome c553